MLLSSLNIKAASGNPVTLTGLVPKTVDVDAGVTLSFTLDGGIVGPVSPYHLYWFWGQSNNTTIRTEPQAVPAPSGCTPSGPCTTPTSASISHVFNATGSYDVSVTAYDGILYDYVVATDLITVVDQPAVNGCVVSPAVIPIDTPMEIWAWASEPVSYSWDFGDGYPTNLEPVSSGGACGHSGAFEVATHYFHTPGMHMVTLNATDQYGGEIRKYFFQNVSDNYPTLYSVTIPATAVAYSAVSVSAIADVPGTFSIPANATFVWNFGDGTGFTLSYGTSAPVAPWTAPTYAGHVYTSPGSYTVTVYVTDRWNNISMNGTTPGTQQANSVFQGTITVSSLSASGSCAIHAVKPIPVGQIEPISINAWEPCVSPTSPFNYTWISPAAKDYGASGRLGSYQYGSSVVRQYINQTSGTNLLSTSQSVTFYDVQPTVGVGQAYVSPIISLGWSGSSSAAVSATVSLWLGNVELQQGILNTGGSTIYLSSYSQELGAPYQVQVMYVPHGATGSATVVLGVNFGNGPVVVDHTFQNNLPTPWFQFVGPLAVGQPMSFSTQYYSPANTGLTVKWTWGDGTSTSQTFSAPAGGGSNLGVFTKSHTYASGANYHLVVTVTDTVSGGQGGRVAYENLTIVDKGNVSVNDSAPVVTASGPGTLAQGAFANFTASATQYDTALGATTVAWVGGDNSTGRGSTFMHTYAYAGAYSLVAFARSPNGSTEVSLLHVAVQSPAPFATMNITAAPAADVPAVFTAKNGGMSSGSNVGETFVWYFGDGTTQAGYGNNTSVVYHSYLTAGRYPVELLVSSAEGRSSAYFTNLTVKAINLGFTIVAPRSTADDGSNFSVRFNATVPITTLPFLNISWSWGGWGTLTPLVSGSYGLSIPHTYFFPGTYKITVTIKDIRNGQVVKESANVTVVDYPTAVDFAYKWSEVYGILHAASFTVQAFGAWSDLSPSHNWQFTWIWGDGTSNTVVKQTNPTDTAMHQYTAEAGVEAMNLTVVSPQASGFTSQLTDFGHVSLLLDSDADGLPDIYENLVSRTSPTCVQTPGCGGSSGTGYTDFMMLWVGDKLGPVGDDPDNDGISTEQELTGSVTGYASDPLDANASGDALSTGANFFTDQFPSTQVVPLAPSGLTAAVNITNVSYQGDAIAFNSSRLFIELNTSTSNLPYLPIYLVLPFEGTFGPMYATSLTDTFYLFNSTPYNGTESTPGMSIVDLAQPSTWQVEVDSTVAVTGSILKASISDSYYTNPMLGDPYRQGMIVGPSVTVPFFNCSQPTNVNFTAFNFATAQATVTDFFPYTESYYKLSELQGVPYKLTWSAAVQAANVVSGGCASIGVPPSVLGWVATYYGDADFGISPWNVHAAGDPGLTNGMKVLGARNYTLTQWHYMNTAGQLISLPGQDPYGPDPLYSLQPVSINSQLPLNPTAYSTAGTGVPDSQSVDPLQALALAVTVTAATDPQCIGTNVPGVWTATDTVVMQVADTGSAQSLVYTQPAAESGGGTLCPSLITTSGYTFSWSGQSFTIPLNNSQSSWNLSLCLWQTKTVLNNPGADVCVSLTGALSNWATVSTPSGADITASATVTPLNRGPALFINTTGEMTTLPGYGARYQGEPEFYAFYVNMGTLTQSQQQQYAPLQSGVNTILESRLAFGQTTMDTDLDNGTVPSSYSCGSTSTVLSRQAGYSAAPVVGAWTADLSQSLSCAPALLALLTPKNGAGTTIGTVTALNTSQWELLGLGVAATGLAAYQPITGYTATSGVQPTSYVALAGQVVLGLATAFAHALYAIGQFFTNLPTELETLGQHLFGILTGALGAIANAGTWLWHALNSLFNFVVWILEQVANRIIDAITGAISAAVSSQAAIFLSMACGAAIITPAVYASIMTALGSSNTGCLSSSQLSSQESLEYGLLVGATVAIVVAVIVANAVADAATDGGDAISEALLRSIVETDMESAMTTALKTVVATIAFSLGIALLADTLGGSNSAIKSTLTTIGLGTNAVNDFIAWIPVFTGFEMWNVVSSSPVQNQFIIPFVLTTESAIIDSVSYAVSAAGYGTSPANLMMEFLSVLLSGAALGYSGTLWIRSDGGTLIFPLGSLETVGSGIDFGVSVTQALQTDTGIL
jgi:PKD domain